MTNMSPSIGQLADALSKAQANISHATKAAENPFFRSKYADLPAVIDAARAALTANKLAVIQTTEVEAGAVTLVTTLAHSSGEWISSRYPVNPTKNDPQGMGSALTYARRYCYASITGVAAIGEDDDGNAASAPNTAKLSLEQAAEIDLLIKNTGADRVNFLKYIKAESVQDIPAKDYLKTKELLEKKGAKK